MGAGAADWTISPHAVLKGDFEYQHKTERDGSGYQLLGGTTLPDINQLFRSTMLGDQPWVLPDTYDTYNTSARFNYTFSPSWSAFVTAGLSHSLIQDNVIYAYGCYYETECNNGTAPPYFFAPDGTYDIYDYRDPGELRNDGEAEGTRDAEQVDRRRPRAHASDDRRPAAEEHQSEGSDKFRDLLIHFGFSNRGQLPRVAMNNSPTQPKRH